MGRRQMNVIEKFPPDSRNINTLRNGSTLRDFQIFSYRAGAENELLTSMVNVEW
ncbi:MAG: hypothetical protein QXF61_10380 [Nitrososphaeria archaeon]